MFGAGCAAPSHGEPTPAQPAAQVEPDHGATDAAQEPPQEPSSAPSEPPTPAATVAPTVAQPDEPLVAPSDPELTELLERYYAGLARADWQAVLAQFWPSCAIVTVRPPQPGGAEEVVSVSVEEYVAEARRNVVRTQPLELATLTSRIERMGSVAHAHVHYRARDVSGDIPQAWESHDVFTFLRHGERWRIAALVLSPDVKAP